jgi:hypothetical protein
VSGVFADERYFLIELSQLAVSAENWTTLEREVMSDHRWWSQAEVRTATDQIWPENLAQMLIEVGVWEGSG